MILGVMWINWRRSTLIRTASREFKLVHLLFLPSAFTLFLIALPGMLAYLIGFCNCKTVA
jgi:hypothetical protein